MENHYILVTSRYRAVCCGRVVVTITLPNEDLDGFEVNEELLAVV
ncbi:hypothetical protein [Cytobacillus oceanisediminis]|nr:hypothetical protein [Cytobacillus oceanisediminis]